MTRQKRCAKTKWCAKRTWAKTRIKIEVVGEDSLCSAKSGQTAAQKLAADTRRTARKDLVLDKAAAEFAVSLGVTKAATIHDGSLYADKLQQVFAEEFQKLGGAITAREAVDPNATEMGSMHGRIAATEPEFIYYPVFIPAGSHITYQAGETPGLEDIVLIGADSMFSLDFWRPLAMQPWAYITPAPTFRPLARAKSFLDKHQAKYGEDTPAPFHAHA